MYLPAAQVHVSEGHVTQCGARDVRSAGSERRERQHVAVASALRLELDLPVAVRARARGAGVGAVQAHGDERTGGRGAPQDRALRAALEHHVGGDEGVEA